MAQNVGKVFERDVMASCPEWLWSYRPPDAAYAFQPSSTMRFSPRSPADWFLFDGEGGFFIAIEMKSVAGTSCSFERTKEDKGVIHEFQIATLTKYAEYSHVVAGFMIDFRGSGNTYFVDIDSFNAMTEQLNKKSFQERELIEYCSPIFIEKHKLRVHYRYDLEKFVRDIRAREENKYE